MTFDDITDDGRLWAVRYDGDEDNALMKQSFRHTSWLRIYAIKLAAGIYIITGGSHKTDCYHAGARTYSSGIAEDGKSSQIPFRREYCG